MRWIVALVAVVLSSHLALAAQNRCVGAVGKKEAKVTTPDLSNNSFRKSDAQTIDGFPNFSHFRMQDVLPALKAALVEYKTKAKQIGENPAPPTFENTILPLENLSSGYEWIFPFLMLRKFNFSNAQTQQTYVEAVSRYSDFHTEFTNNPKLFERVKQLYNKRHELGLAEDQIRLVESHYEEFAEGGVHLTSNARAMYVALQKRSAELSAKYTDNLHRYKMNNGIHVERAKDLDGVPAEYVKQFRAAAKAKGLKGYYISAGDIASGQVLQYGKNRDLREKVWRMIAGEGYSGRPNNRDLVWQIAENKHQIAQVLGYESHAENALKDSMAKSVEFIEGVIDSLVDKIMPVVRPKREKLLAYIKNKEGGRKPMQWDVPFWMREFDKEHFQFDASKMRDYFTLDQVMPKMMEFISGIFQIEIILRSDLKGMEEDSLVYEVRKDGRRYGYVLFDLYARPNKDGGASHYSMQSSKEMPDGSRRLAIGAIQTNFNRPVKGEPTKLGLSELKTLFHEFGHALHNVLSEARYESQSGTSVARDIVELPSQFMENFLLERDILMSLSSHYKTGEPIPAKLVEAAYAARQDKLALRYYQDIQAIQLDFAWYKAPVGEVTDLYAFERKATASTEIVPVPKNRFYPHSTDFSHIFTSGYSAFYYSYLWSKIHDADAFAQFKREGLFNPHVARRWVDKVLAVGDARDPKQAFEDFMGRPVDVNSLLIRDGIIPNQ